MGLRLSLEQMEAKSGTLPVFIAEPNDTNKYPGLIIVHEIFGLTDHTKDLAQRFARLGLRVYAPDLFYQAIAKNIDRSSIDEMRKFFFGITDSQIIGDMEAVFQLACKNPNIMPEKIGALGHCMGGALGLIFACSQSKLAFLIDYYGRLVYPPDQREKSPIDYLPGLNCPLLGFFSGIDQLIPMDQIHLFEKKLDQLGKTYEIKIYPNSKHAFFNDTREFYDREAAEDSWEKSLEFIKACTGSTLSLSTAV